MFYKPTNISKKSKIQYGTQSQDVGHTPHEETVAVTGLPVKTI